MNFPVNLSSQLEERKKNNNFRSLMVVDDLIDFTSNDYFSLASTLTSHSLLKGSGGSRLLSGNYKEIEDFEQQLSRQFNMTTATSFSSGYLANVGLLSCIAQAKDVILFDERCHSSLKDGARLSLARKISFKHNDISSLEKRIIANKVQRNIFVITEGLFSMDGDFASLQAIIELSNYHDNVYVIIDEAHSAGIKGNCGSGLCSSLDLDDKIFAKIITFGKAIGSSGAAILGSEKLKIYLTNFCRTFIYSTSPAPASIACLTQNLTLIEDNCKLWQRDLMKKVSLFRSKMEKKELLISQKDSPIQSVLIVGNEKAKKVAIALQEHKFDVRAILSPTVRLGYERVRICLHLHNHDEEIINLVNCLNEIL